MGKNKIPNRQDYKFGCDESILKSKDELIEQYILYMFARLNRVFEYENLPESLPARELELLLQMGSFAVFKKVDGKLYAFYGGLGGKPNPYYEPTISVIANPGLKYSATLEIDENCVLIWNDSAHIGLLPMARKYAELLAETDITLRFGLINSRILSILRAKSDSAKESAELFLKDVENGEKLGVLMDDSFIEDNFINNIDSVEYKHANVNDLKSVMELQQYLKASWFNEIGLQANYNMKRESLNGEEVGLNEESLKPLIDDMLDNRQSGLEKVNSMFGTNIKVHLGSSWKARANLGEETKEELKTDIKETKVEEKENKQDEEV